MAKRYKYEDRIYCEDDLSEEIDNYGGDLLDLCWELTVAGEAVEWTHYAASGEPVHTYDSAEELIEKEFGYLED